MRRLKNFLFVTLFCGAFVAFQNVSAPKNPAMFGWLGSYAKSHKQQAVLCAANIACDGCWALAIAGSGISAGASFLIGAGITA